MTTARFHLDVLQRAGMVRRPAERAGQVGRPRQLYAVVAAPEAGEGYRQLADVLAGGLAADPDVGPRWAERALPAMHLGLLCGALSLLRVPAAEHAGLRPFV